MERKLLAPEITRDPYNGKELPYTPNPGDPLDVGRVAVVRLDGKPTIDARSVSSELWYEQALLKFRERWDKDLAVLKRKNIKI